MFQNLVFQILEADFCSWKEAMRKNSVINHLAIV